MLAEWKQDKAAQNVVGVPSFVGFWGSFHFISHVLANALNLFKRFSQHRQSQDHDEQPDSDDDEQREAEPT